jgi:hypothetical protein
MALTHQIGENSIFGLNLVYRCENIGHHVHFNRYLDAKWKI